MKFTVFGAAMVVLLVMCAAVLVLAARRFFMLRERGTAVLLRALPAQRSRGWRHGIIRYDGQFAEYYKLRSLSLSADNRISSLDIELKGQRALDDDEAAFMPPNSHIVCFDFEGRPYELASDLHGVMAFGAWVEAAPSKRKEKLDHRELRRRATRFGKP